MAYTALNTTDIEAGKPVKEEIFDQIRTNQEHFNSELTGLSGTSKVDIFNMRLIGDMSHYSISGLNTRLPVFRAIQDADPGVIEFKATLLTASSSGTLTLDLQKSTNDGVSYSSILAAPITLTGTTAGSQSSTPTFADATFNQGGMFRVIITTIQSGQGQIHISAYGEL